MPRTSEARRSEPVVTDGRMLRAERSREAISKAVFELIGEGHLMPTAQQVAERARVGIRSVFRHFSDMEALYATVDARLLDDVIPMLREEPPAGGLRKRAQGLVARREVFFERIAPYKRASNLKRWRSPYLSTQHRKLVSELRAGLLRWIPELESAPRETVEALDQATSFEAWDRLRCEQRLGRTRARSVMERAAVALLDTLPDRGASGSR